jgi:hypothetical protein
VPAARNAANLMAGSGVQQTRGPDAEKAVEVVRNHEDGTGVGAWNPRPEAARTDSSVPPVGVDASGTNGGEA